jgi:glycine/D-amino acid oxidase-like deaminating enzyme
LLKKIRNLELDYIIVGQGIAGTLLSFELIKAGKRVLVIDNKQKQVASRTAAAILNPLAGKHWQLSVSARCLIAEAIATYKILEQWLGVSLVFQRPLHIFFDVDQKLSHFKEQLIRYPQYLSIADPGDLSGFYNESGIGVVHDVYQVDAELLIETWCRFLQQRQAFLVDSFDVQQLELAQEHLSYRGFNAQKIIFCEGAAAIHNPFTHHLPFTRNRGDALLFHIPDLNNEYIYHKEYRLAPFPNNLFWLGSNYTWRYDDLSLDNVWRDKAIDSLKSWLKLPFELIDHLVAERPTTAGQKIFASLHPEYPQVAYFNGLGTRGFSAGPHWATRLAKILMR